MAVNRDITSREVIGKRRSTSGLHRFEREGPRWFSARCRLWLVAGIVSVGTWGCAKRPQDFSGTTPVIDIQKFYTGHTRSTSVIESRGGKPLRRVETETWGRMREGELELTQDIRIDGGRPERRVWKIRRLDAHHFEATTDSVIGPARGESYGNAFTFSYTLALQPGNPLSHVQMRH